MKTKEKKNKFKCKKCEKTLEIQDSESILPECCDLPMERLEDPAPCLLTATAEHARPDELPEPCDDGREGKI